MKKVLNFSRAKKGISATIKMAKEKCSHYTKSKVLKYIKYPFKIFVSLLILS